MLHHALSAIGIKLTDAQETMALAGVNRNFNSYVQLRQIDVPLDTEPAFRFLPAAPAITHARFAPRKPEHPKVRFCRGPRLPSGHRTRRPASRTPRYFH
jgi:hypothetical protein